MMLFLLVVVLIQLLQSSGVNTIDTGDGADIINMGVGADIISAGAGNDVISVGCNGSFSQ